MFICTDGWNIIRIVNGVEARVSTSMDFRIIFEDSELVFNPWGAMVPVRRVGTFGVDWTFGGGSSYIFRRVEGGIEVFYRVQWSNTRYFREDGGEFMVPPWTPSNPPWTAP